MKSIRQNSLVQRLYSAVQRISYRLYRGDVRHSEEYHRREFMRCAFHALNFNGISGDYAEFGSHGGTTFAFAYHEIIRWPRTRKLWAFDSFTGLPDQKGEEDYHPGWKRGKMATSLEAFVGHCRRRGIPDDAYKAVPGFYEDTIGAASTTVEAEFPGDIAICTARPRLCSNSSNRGSSTA